MVGEPLRALPREEIDDRDRDGVPCSRGLLDRGWLERMADAFGAGR